MIDEQQKLESEKIRIENEIRLQHLERANEQKDLLIERLARRSKSDQIINNNTNNGTVNNITNNITIQFKDDPTLKRFLTEAEKQLIMSKGGLAPNIAFKTLYYNPNRPQLHQAYASDTKLNKMMIYNGKKFILANYNETLKTMINNSIDCVEQIYEEIEETEDDMYNYRYVKKLLDKLNNNQNSKEREETMALIVSELKNEPYNCRELILQTHGKIRIISI